MPVVFTDEEESKGIKRGGVLNIVRHELELICDAAEIPDEITISLKGTDVGDSIHISQVKLPKGVTSAIDDRDFTIATLIAPSALKSETLEQVAEEAACSRSGDRDEHVAEVEAEEAAAKPLPKAKPRKADERSAPASGAGQDRGQRKQRLACLSLLKGTSCRLWVGLGNPGAQYALQRHNVGFMVVDTIADLHDFGPVKKAFQGWTQEGRIGPEKILLLKPATFMNESGRSIGEAMRFYKLDGRRRDRVP